MKISNIVSRKNRILLRELVVTEFKLRYQDSILGFLWSLLKPLLMFAILYFVFGQLLRIGSDIEHYAVYLLLGVVLWNFFVEATGQGLSAIVARGDLIRKINFPKYIIVVSGTISALINLTINLVVIGVFMAINGVDLLATAPLVVLPIAMLYVLSLAIAFFLSAANVKYRDVGHIWDIFVQAAFYATPILYPISMVLERSSFIGHVLMLSPVAQTIQDARYFLITHQTITSSQLFGKWYFDLIPYALTAIVVVVASLYFKKSSKYFAENV
ncbi:MAG TPA: ABC transporter permease [Candidatus Saccharimonadales bacterium]|nr:ABC transporter permease [Candidatus Saccharimonadales bacterium]